jgi:hypothetical protein
MKNFVKDLSVIVVAVAAGLLFASAVQAQGLGNGFGNGTIVKTWSGNGNRGHYRGYKRPHRAKWRQDRRSRVIYVVSPPPALVYVPVAAPVVTPTVNASYCREFNSTAVIGGREVPVYGTMCRQPDGSWTTVE